MKAAYISCIFFLLLISCIEKEVQYYDNGKILSEAQKRNGEYHGDYKKYWKNGQLRQLRKYEYGELKALNFHDSLGNLKSTQVYQKKDSILTTIYNSLGTKSRQGFINENLERFGIWTRFDEKGNVEAFAEFFHINNEPYVNRTWFVDSKKDTITGSGNYFHYSIKSDTIVAGEDLEILFVLKEPFFKGKESEIDVSVPYFENMECVDFEKIKNQKIKLDRFDNLFRSRKAEFPRTASSPKYKVDIRKKVMSIGKRCFKGILREYYYDSVPKDGINPSIPYERFLYFDIPYFVKDTI